MPFTCVECGEIYVSDETCQQRFEACLALEYENPIAYGTVHLLSVACYMLQHNLYSREGWLETRELVRLTISQESTPADILKKNRDRLDSRVRKWSLTKGEKLAGFAAIRWSRTIADIRLENPQDYISDVKQWAISVLEDTLEIHG